ncbi:MAG TPA: aminotransferase class I/II-fold pyridoxal phosphate-dependent enzyme [Terriglobales bacterium]|nr:aminotransferase class I/II-fold pyridoxal phosphate-dependent enzyme [Terriglobales bacterium]
MQVSPFRIEHYFSKHEFSARYLLSSSDAESRTIQEVLDLEPGSHQRLLRHWCGYTESPGAPWLRATIAGIYKNIAPEQILVVSSAEEGILLAYNALLGSSDHAIVETPCFESGLELARSTGAEVSEWRRKPELGWAHNVKDLEKLIRRNTKILYICTPHNPLGLLMPRNVLQEVVALCRDRGIILFCDEVFRELEHDPATRLPAVCELYENAISLGSMSKTYGLPGLRLGWLVTRNASFLQRCLEVRYYTTICNSAPSEFLCDVALRHRQVLIERNLEIVRKNLPLLEAFFREHAGLFEWVKPNASPMCFPAFKGSQSVSQLCDDVVRDVHVMLLPGSVYDEPGHIRFGYGRKNMPEALERLSSYLDSPAQNGQITGQRMSAG